MAVSTKEYYEGILKQAGVSDAKRQALVAALDDEEVSKALLNEQIAPRLRHDEFSREMDKLKKQKDETTDYYNKLVTWKNEQDQAYAAALAGINGNGNGNGSFVNQGDFISKKDFEAWQKQINEAAQAREANFITISKKVGRLASRHAAKFGEELDTDALEKVVVEQKVDLDRAYELMVADRLKAQQDASLAERIKREREEAVREFASTRQIPIDSAPRDNTMGRLNLTPDKNTAAEHVPFEGRLTPAGAAQLRNSFVEEWNKAGSTGG